MWLLVVMSGCGSSTPDVTITISSPNGTVYTNDEVAIQVAVVGANPTEVELRLDEAVLVSVTPPFSYTWDTTDVAEATYELRARVAVGGAVFESTPRTIVVDRTPPQVVERKPSPNADNVFVGDPIDVRFSEAVKESTVTSGSVAVTSSGDIAVETSRALAEDGAGLTILLSGNPAIPTSLSVTLTDDITDLAGNALAVPPTDWTLSLPFWQLVGGRTPLNIDPERNAWNPEVAADGPQGLIVTWTECSAGLETCEVHVKRWDGTQWSRLGTALTVNDASSGVISSTLAIGADNQPLVAFNALRGAWNTWVQRWDEGTWQDLGASLNRNVDDTAQEPFVVLESTGNPVVTWREGPTGEDADVLVKRWSGSTWQQVGAPLDITLANEVLSPAIAVDSGDRPLVAWAEGPTDNQLIYVKRWDAPSWEQLGTQVSRNAGYHSRYPRVIVDKQDRPLVAWSEGPGGIGNDSNVYVSRWSGTSWSLLGGALDSDLDNRAGVGSLALDQSDAPIVCVDEALDAPSPDNAFVKRWDGVSWHQLGDLLVVSPSRTRTNCGGLGLAGSGYPVVAIYESGGVHVMRMNAVVRAD
jgi:hypothetical protein